MANNTDPIDSISATEFAEIVATVAAMPDLLTDRERAIYTAGIVATRAAQRAGESRLLAEQQARPELIKRAQESERIAERVAVLARLEPVFADENLGLSPDAVYEIARAVRGA